MTPPPLNRPQSQRRPPAVADLGDGFSSSHPRQQKGDGSPAATGEPPPEYSYRRVGPRLGVAAPPVATARRLND